MASPYSEKLAEKSLILSQKIHKIVGLISQIQSYNFLPEPLFDRRLISAEIAESNIK
jgi:hypothetical protein